MYGPELWRADAGGDWSYWDLWFAVLCVRDHGGDWDGFDAALTKIRGDGGEAKWSHLLDLRERLAAAGLDVVELVGDTITEKGVVTRARARVFKQSLSVCDMTPPMRNPPARRLEERGRRGWWPRFPSSPQDPHDRLRAARSSTPVGSAAASARSRSANVDGDPIVDRHQDDDVGPSVAAIIQSRVTPGIPVNGVRTGRWRRSRRSGKVSSGPGLVAVCLCWSGRCGQAPQLDDLLGRVMSSLPRMWRWETVSSVR